MHATLGDTPDPRYLDDDEQQILIEDDVSLLVLPNREYGELQIVLQNENARIAEISLALAANAHFSLPEHDYDYRFNANTGRVEIFNRADQRVLALPVDAQGLTPWVRAGKREETRIEVDPVTLTLIEETLPNEQPLVTVGEAPEQVELVEASSITPGEIALSWLATIDNDTPTSQIRYLLHAATDSGFVPDGSTEYAEYVGATSGTITGLLPETRYYLKVEAVDAAGHRSWSNELSAVTARVAPLETSAPRVVLDSSNTRDLTISADSLSYRLSNGASAPAVGDIITSALGDGLLRRVTAISTNADQVTLETEPADLVSLFDTLQLSSDLKLIDVPEAQAQAHAQALSATTRQSLSATPHSGGGHSVHWPEHGLTITEWPLSTSLQGSAAAFSNRATALGRSATKCNGRGSGRETDTDAPLWLSGPEVVCVEAGNRMRFDMAATLQGRDVDDYRLTALEFKGLTHPGQSTAGADWSAPTEGASQRTGTLSWRPSDAQVDTKGRPFTARFTATAVKRDCWVFCTRRVDLEVPIYVAWGDTPVGDSTREPFSSSNGRLTLSGEAGVDFQPELTIEAALHDSRVDAATVRVDGPLAFRTEVTLDASASGNYDFEQKLLDKQFRRVFMAGQVPFLVSGELRVTVQFRAEAEANLEIIQTLDLGYDLSAGLAYTDSGGWRVISEASPWQKYKLSGEADSAAEVELRFVPDLTVRFYEALSGRLLIEPYLYGQAGLEGHFVYRGGSDGSSSDADYRFTELEFGGGIDGRLRLGLEVFDYQLAGFPSRNPDDLHAFTVIGRTPILGLPTLTLQATGGRDPERDCAIELSAQYEDVPNPFGSGSLNPFVEDSGAWQVVEPNGTETLEPGDEPMQAWFSAEEAGPHTLRFSGHSELGSFVRQYEEIEVTFDQNDEACACDQGLIAGRYQPIGEDCGIIRDLANGLDWQRCAVGKTWDPVQQDCLGKPDSFNRDEALTLTAPGGFRLPTISELRTLVYCSSGQPVLFGMPEDYARCEGDSLQPTIVVGCLSSYI